MGSVLVVALYAPHYVRVATLFQATSSNVANVHRVTIVAACFVTYAHPIMRIVIPAVIYRKPAQITPLRVPSKDLTDAQVSEGSITIALSSLKPSIQNEADL